MPKLVVVALKMLLRKDDRGGNEDDGAAWVDGARVSGQREADARLARPSREADDRVALKALLQEVSLVPSQRTRSHGRRAGVGKCGCGCRWESL